MKSFLLLAAAAALLLASPLEVSAAYHRPAARHHSKAVSSHKPASKRHELQQLISEIQSIRNDIELLRDEPAPRRRHSKQNKRRNEFYIDAMDAEEGEDVTEDENELFDQSQEDEAASDDESGAEEEEQEEEEEAPSTDSIDMAYYAEEAESSPAVKTAYAQAVEQHNAAKAGGADQKTLKALKKNEKVLKKKVNGGLMNKLTGAKPSKAIKTQVKANLASSAWNTRRPQSATPPAAAAAPAEDAGTDAPADDITSESAIDSIDMAEIEEGLFSSPESDYRAAIKKTQQAEQAGADANTIAALKKHEKLLRDKVNKPGLLDRFAGKTTTGKATEVKAKVKADLAYKNLKKGVATHGSSKQAAPAAPAAPPADASAGDAGADPSADASADPSAMADVDAEESY